MQCIHVVNCDFKHDFTLVRCNRSNGFAQVSNFLPLGNSFIRFHETHEFLELAIFDQCSNNEYCFSSLFGQRKEYDIINMTRDSNVETSSPLYIWTPAGQKPNTLNPDLVT